MIEAQKRKKNTDIRSREYLSTHEIKAICKAVRQTSRNPIRDETLINTMFIHGLRVSEATYLKWSQIDLKDGLFHCKRLKNGIDSTHPIQADEMKLLIKLKKLNTNPNFVFLSERQIVLSMTSIHRIISNAGNTAGLSFPIHPHMLRHSCGYYLANNGEDTRSIQHWMGHRNIENTEIYTSIGVDRFKNGFFEDYRK